jgi:outer membrane immunogenic protein
MIGRYRGPLLIVIAAGGFAMHRALLGSIAAVALASVSSAALAADMVPPAPVPSWTGIYLGAGGGIQFGDINADSKLCELLYDRESQDRYCNPYDTFEKDFHDHDSTFVGVVQGGYDIQIGPYYVTGAFVDWSFGDLGSDHRRVLDEEDGVFGKWNTDVQNMLTIAGRQGFLPMPNLLVYGLAGWSWADVDHKFKIDCDECSDPIAKAGDDFNANGITVGAGAEYKVTDNISIRGEYRFTDLENASGHRFFEFEDDDYFVKSSADVSIQQVLFTLNWRFGGFGLPF